MTLAQFSKGLMSGKAGGELDCAGETTEVAGLEGLGQKQFAADVAAAMSNPETPSQFRNPRQ
jgi:hypothetical protein